MKKLGKFWNIFEKFGQVEKWVPNSTQNLNNREIFGDVFDSFIGDIEFYAQNMEILHRQPNLIKFLVFNLTERFPPKKYEDNTCDFDYGFDLFKNSEKKTPDTLMFFHF